MIIPISTPRGEVVLRPTREADAAAYRALRLEGLQDHPEAFGSDYESSAARPLAFWEERMRQGAQHEHGVAYVAEAAGTLVGMTTLVRYDQTKARHSGAIVGVYTTPAWRGTGVAGALLAACLAHAQALGMRIVRLGVATTNAPAIRLYLRQGFQVYGVEQESILVEGVYYDELLMAKRLVQP